MHLTLHSQAGALQGLGSTICVQAKDVDISRKSTRKSELVSPFSNVAIHHYHTTTVIFATRMKRSSLLVGLSLVATTLFTSCSLFGGGKVDTPDNENLLADFNTAYFAPKDAPLQPDQLALYVDYSTCIADGQHSAFFQALVPSWKATAKSYYSIEGSTITPHDADSTYTLLRTIEEKNYADLKTAAERIANGNTEGVLLTDGEYFQPSVAKGNVNNPYLTEAFKTWLKKGHDVYILIEPYEEVRDGQSFAKKRFYFLFTDRRLADNIYQRILQTVRLEDYPGTSDFHLSACDPALLSSDGQGFNTAEVLSAKVKTTPYRYEVENWEVDWHDAIHPMLIDGVDSLGNPLPNGVPFASGLTIDCNSLGGYRIASVKARVLNINQPFADFVAAKEAKQKPEATIDPTECEHFVKVDDAKFKKKGVVDLCFDRDMFNPDDALNGTPFNYFMVQILVDDIEPLFAEHKSLFSFESIDLPGQQNVSVAASIEQCLVDPDIKNMIVSRPIYTVYVKSMAY